ncbi:MAG: FliI/YscN family ATPase [Proteobacteria bacterium]|nr:FliI/YscN family ATPase [Pseudomonadota bacterium]MBS0572874.1 FliI/YscN family ATPase [Pseudomonadota bacterium]
MSGTMFQPLQDQIAAIRPARPIARVSEVGRGLVRVGRAGPDWRMGDRVHVRAGDGATLGGEIVLLDAGGAAILTDRAPDGLRPGDPVALAGDRAFCPHEGWIGRIIDPFGQPLDGRPLAAGPLARPLRTLPPPAAARRKLGARLETGMRLFNTMLPLVRGQRIGLFAGSGVGKSTLLGELARRVEADLIVIALIGERGRELREFAEDVLGREGRARSIVVAATSDQSPLVRRRCAWAAMAVAEHFRDQGRHVLFLADSITRLAEAHREIALGAGEPAALRGYPPSTAPLVMALAERAGPGAEGAGDITAVFSVLVAGSDMDEPVADILRGTLDGHVVLDRAIAERGRFPAVDLLRSVSRSLPAAASAGENRLIGRARRLLGAYERAELMIQAGLYAAGSDPLIDAAIRVWTDLDAFMAEEERADAAASFARLGAILGRAGLAEEAAP